MATSLSDDERRQVLGETLMDELKVIREYVQVIPQLRQEVNSLSETVNDLVSDMKVIKTAVRDNSRELALHDTQIAELRAA